METKQRKKRGLVRGILWLMAVGIVLLALLPLWFPWLLTPVASRYGLGFADYDRIGWTRFALTGVHGAWDGTRLEVKRVECVLPPTWLWRRFDDRTNDPPLVSLIGGHLMIGVSTTNAGNAASAEQEGSMDETLNQISQIGPMLQRFLPVANLTNCTIQVASSRLSIPHAEWRAGRLNAVVRIPSSRREIELAAQMDGNLALKLAANWAAYDASLRCRFSRTAGEWRSDGELDWLTNRANLTARFATNGWWPVQARVVCQRWQIPAGSLQIQGYENLVASLTANLVSNRFDLQATGFAQPSESSAKSGWPAVNFSLGADGDPGGVKLHALNIQSPWLDASLTNTVGITWTSELLAESAQLRVSVDLDKLPGTTFTGRAEGLVGIKPRGGLPPVAQFRFSGADVRAGQLDAKTVLVRGEFAAPILKFDEIRADFADGSVMVADGSFDREAQRIDGGHWKLSGGFLQKLLPDLSYARLVASGELRGPLTNLTHRSEAAFTTFRAAGLKPFDLRAKWSGQNQRLTAANVEWTAAESVLSIAAAADFNLAERKVEATLNQLSLRREKEKLYALQQPCAITFRSGNTNVPGHLWALAVNAFNWRSERHSMSGTADLAWPSHGEATLTMTNVAFADFADFLEADIANVLVAELAATAHWSNGPVHSAISATGSMTNGTGQVFGLRGAVQTDEFLKLELSALASGYTPTLSVTGTVPVKVIPERRQEMLVWDKSQSIALAGDWKDDQTDTYSLPLGSWGRLDVLRPEVQFRVSGTPDEPSAELTMTAAKLAWPSKTNDSPRPRLEDLQLEAEIRPDALRMKTFAAKLDGQPIMATGEWPLPGKAWRELWSTQKLPAWDQAHGHLKLEEAQVAALSAYLPEVLSPEGRLNATLDLKTGKRLEGVLSLTNAATRPIGPITPLRDVAALVRFDGNRAVLQDFRAQIGGQPIRADGFVTVPQLDGTGLDYHVNLHGTNVPLTRSPELLLRGDFSVSLRGGSNLPPLLSGAVTLRDGLYVQHASALVWSAPRRPEWLPPYFSVTNKPFADWKLQLAVRGDRFLRLRAPVFSGIVSADFQLNGSLLAPVLTGDARVNSGRLIFPFGSLTIDQGLASFSGNDSRGPDLQINASGRNYHYDLRLEVKGPADGANVNFSSTPPLASEQILLMLTAGEIPRSDYAFSNSARAGRLVTFLGRDMFSRYFGSDPDKERLIIQTGESISEAGRLTYSVEYRLTDRWSVIGEYDEFNAFNTDFKWKVFTR
ncbi:MAG: translocation/assembly module TamB domain-containing protein [Verrucomicrobiota bacterium]